LGPQRVILPLPGDKIIGEKFYIYAAERFPTPRDVKRFCKLKWKEKSDNGTKSANGKLG
jgi:hypothetical protein